MKIKIALAGNPNSGKTSVFNVLTGSSQYVGNWPGVTVEKKSGKLRSNKAVELVDLPGIYSLSPYTLEEVVSRNYLSSDEPTAVIDIIDATNIERNLYLTTQLMELGLPVVASLNMADLLEKNGITINTDKLSQMLGIPVIKTSALKNQGCSEVAAKAIELSTHDKVEYANFYPKDIHNVLNKIAEIIANKVDNRILRWYSVKVFERDKELVEKLNLADKDKQTIEDLIVGLEKRYDDDSESIITNERYNFITEVVKKTVAKKNKGIKMSTSDKIDRIVTNRFLALPIFAAIMFLIYYLAISTIGGLATDWVEETLFGEIVPTYLGGFLERIQVAEWLQSLIMDGIVNGVGAVLSFLPQMAVLFILLGILEDIGYMSRIAFIMDKLFRRFGLSGKSFIPMLIGSGCSVPGIMASRTIESDKDRKMTIITTSFIPCSAKLPVIALIAGALFKDAFWVAPIAYFIGIAAVVVSGVILKKTKMFEGDAAPFIMELPPYHIPSVRGVGKQAWDRIFSFVKKAGTIIFISSVIIWFLSSFSWKMAMVDATDSMLASIGRVIAVIFIPLGWGNWESAVATVAGLVAKENVVSSFGILYGFTEVSETGVEIWSSLQAVITPLAGFSFLTFNLLCAPCFAAIGAIKKEMLDTKWTLFAIVYQTLLAYIISLIVYQVGMLFSGSFGVWSVIALVALAVFLYMLFRSKNREKRLLPLMKKLALKGKKPTA